MSLRRLLAAWAVFPLAFLIVAGVPSRGDELSREQQLADIDRQIAELTRRRDELLKQPAGPKPIPGTLDANWVKALNWRCIGPATMGGRIVAVAVFEADPSTYWIATASGGLLKTVNNGVTFEHQFDREGVVSIGDVAVAPSNRDVVYVGTGENNPRNSVSYGDGVYKSTDGGKTWKNVGLKKSFQIGRIAVHPLNPDIVYVGALGRLYGPSAERGLYKTTDGGKSWNKVLDLDDVTGVIDVQLSPKDPETLLAAAWERRRDGFDSHPGDEPMEDGYDGYDPIRKWGPKSGIYKSTDGGKTWKRSTKGLPSCDLGRCSFDHYRKDGAVVFAIVDSARVGQGLPPNSGYIGVVTQTVEGGAKVARLVPMGPAAKAGLQVDDVVVAADKKPVKNEGELTKLILAGKVGDKIVLSVKRDKQTLDITAERAVRPEEPRPLWLGVNGTPTPQGIKVTAVARGSPAEAAGLKTDDLITAVADHKITKLEEIRNILKDRKDGDKLTLTIRRGDTMLNPVVTLVLQPKTRPNGAYYGGQRENVQDHQGPDGDQTGGVYRSADGGESWQRVNSLNPRPMYFSCIRVDPTDEKYVYVGGVALHRSSDGGKTFSADGGNGVHPDQHAIWINPRDGRHILTGTDGGTYVSYDRMNHWDHLAHAAIGQFYHVAVDNRKPYHVYGGMQDNGSWGGPSRGLDGTGPRNHDWIMVGGGDGFVCRVDAEDADVVYWEMQDGNLQRNNIRTGERRGLRPQGPYRWNWNTPFLLSQHNSRIYYCAANVVFRSVDRGRDLKVMSPEITATKRGSATALAESPRNADVLYAGTDDGNLWGTKDGGKTWTDLTANLLGAKTGVPARRWVSTIEPSRFKEGRVYVVLDGHRSDDDEPYVLVSEDYGQGWKSLRANLPWGSTRVLREDVANEELLYLGTEFACWATLNRGESWVKISNNLPTVAIHEIAVHPTAGEIVAATHGRSLWILDVSALRQMKKDVLTKDAFLYQPSLGVRWRNEPMRGARYGEGSKRYLGDNPSGGMPLYYSLNRKADKITLKIVDIGGKVVRELKASPEVGLHRIAWDLTRPTPDGGAVFVSPGPYRVELRLNDKEELTQVARVEGDPTLPTNVQSNEVPEDPGERVLRRKRED